MDGTIAEPSDVIPRNVGVSSLERRRQLLCRLRQCLQSVDRGVSDICLRVEPRPADPLRDSQEDCHPVYVMEVDVIVVIAHSGMARESTFSRMDSST